MSSQLTLALRERTDRVCAFGETGNDWGGDHHCAACAAEVEDACQRFDEVVARGEYDAEGYSPAERLARGIKQRRPKPLLAEVS